MRRGHGFYFAFGKEVRYKSFIVPLHDFINSLSRILVPSLNVCTQLLSISGDGHDVPYQGASCNGDKESAAARTTHPIPPACGMYHYEVKFASQGNKGFVHDTILHLIFIADSLARTSSCLACQKGSKSLAMASWKFSVSKSSTYHGGNTSVSKLKVRF
ncbi:hypothetical protein C8F04DRAFT_1118705 [Mycena alexandri]|uniref:Uncharacterized protein n=1 Tax=Mycena alexandri TaxID=1745969 RepID=A0AAD6SIF7_9AGAR|nr:hypothetical protein C8F04DRAFT_1125151 [Mycena alexandri]KAJ7028624.1 hypothetical protein C8F04DRAFT_1118705 [Mycena alexandri]